MHDARRRLAAAFEISCQAITKHLRMMERAGLVRSRRRGRERVCRVSAPRLEEVRRHLDTMSQLRDDALSRLRRIVEECAHDEGEESPAQGTKPRAPMDIYSRLA